MPVIPLTIWPSDLKSHWALFLMFTICFWYHKDMVFSYFDIDTGLRWQLLCAHPPTNVITLTLG